MHEVKMPSKQIIYESTIICPFCKSEKEELMPENACQHFYESTNCGRILKPKDGDCCVFCSYGTVKCPSKQKEENVK